MSKSLDAAMRQNRTPIMLSDDEVMRIDDWRFANRIATRSEAIRRLIAIGLSTPTDNKEDGGRG